MCTMNDVLRWVKTIDSFIGKEYTITQLPPNLHNNKFHRYAIKHGIVKKAIIINKQGHYVPKRDPNTANYIWEISVGDTKHRNFYNTL